MSHWKWAGLAAFAALSAGPHLGCSSTQVTRDALAAPVFGQNGADLKFAQHAGQIPSESKKVISLTGSEEVPEFLAPTIADSQPATLNSQPSTNIDFAAALALVSGQNPQVAFAQERINEAFAQLEAADVLWLPSIRAGASYNKHEGNLQASNGGVLDISRGSAYTGFGAQAVGTGSPAVSGLWAQFHLADALFQPIIARRTASARQHAASATMNDMLLEGSLAYLELLRAVQERAVANETVANARRLAELTTAFAEAGQGEPADADRARAELAVRENEVIRADEAIAVASARLAEVLSLDPTLKMQPAEPNITRIDLVSLETPVADLVATGLSNRPELSGSRLLVSRAVERLKRERYAPLIPSLLLGLSYGGFGGGTGGDVDRYRDRLDLDAAVYWEVRNLGFGERAARDEAHSRVHQAQFRQVQLLDQIAREVAEAHAQVQSRVKQITIAETGIEAARSSYSLNVQRIREGEGLPLEVLQSLQALDQARREYLRAINGYNAAQFRLHRALGWPIAW